MDEEFVQELERIASQPGNTPKELRLAAKTKLNGTASGYPLIVRSGHKGPAMRFERNGQPTLWVAVPESWLKLEP